MNKTPQPLSKLIERFFKELGEEQRLREIKVFEVWNKVVGEKISENAKPVQIEKGRLVVVVRNSIWLSELGFERHKLKQRLNRLLGRGTVKEIIFRIGNLPAKEEAKEALKEPKPKHLLTQEWEEKLKQIQDPELRDMLKSYLEALDS